MMLPDLIESEEELDNQLSMPSAELIEYMSNLEGDIIILGIAGKMGLTLGLMALRAIKEAGVDKDVYGVARFSDPATKEFLDSKGIKTLKCDLLDQDSVKKLPKCKNVIFMAGKKFGTQGAEAQTWAMNTIVPANVAQHYTDSKIVVFSTGCVYSLMSKESGGSKESEAPAPIGDYAQSSLGRERVFQYYSEANDTPINIYRLFYAIDLRYGVLHDIGQQILNDEPVDANVGYFNMIWQADANNRALLSLKHCSVGGEYFNITGDETHSVKDIALKLAKHMGKDITFAGEEGNKCYLANTEKAQKVFDKSTVDFDTIVKWQAHWLQKGGRSLGKPTHFEVNNGSF